MEGCLEENRPHQHGAGWTGTPALPRRTKSLAAVLLYLQTLGRDPAWPDDIIRAKQGERLPALLTRNAAQAPPPALDGVASIMAMLLYGVGSRLMERLRLCVRDGEVGNENVVCEGRGRQATAV